MSIFPATPEPRQVRQELATLDGVAFHYPGTERLILSDVTLHVPKGKITALIGGSGSGKTTILRLLGGLYRAQKGIVSFKEKNVGELKYPQIVELRRQMGLLLQFGALFTDMSVFDNVAFPLREHTDLSESMIRDLVLMKLNAVGLRGAHLLMPSEISGGMSRRVALARAIALDPELMLYDEPFTGLDPISMSVIARLIYTLNHTLGLTSVVVTHDIEESFAICDYVYVLANGKIIEQGTPDEIRASTNEYVQQFIYGKADGKVPFHFPSKTDLATDFGVKLKQGDQP